MISYVCCIESGPLELMTLRLAQSIRRHAGALRDAPIYAVTPRRGPALTRATLSELRRLNVEHLSIRPDNPYAWHQFTNKAFALAHVEQIAQTPLVAWLDSDMLVLGEPEALKFEDDYDFAACALEKGGIGSAGPHDPNDPYWAALCRSLGMKLDDLPWVVAKEENVRVRLYFNSGTFVYRRATQFAAKFVEAHRKLFEARIAHPAAGIHFLQPLLGLTVARHNLRWRELPHSHHYTVHGWDKFTYTADELRDVKVLHYHNAMAPHCWPDLLACLKESHPHVHEWLARLGPVVDPRGSLARIHRQLLRALRSLRRRAFLRTCTVVR